MCDEELEQYKSTSVPRSPSRASEDPAHLQTQLDIMVCTGVLKAVLLLSLLSLSIGTNVGIPALQVIVNKIREHGDPVFATGLDNGPSVQQYSVAVKVTKNECLTAGLTSPIENELNSPEFAETKTNALLFKKDHVIAATFLARNHAEYRLLIEENQAVLRNLNDNDCVIFYTYNSPCLKTCLNQEKHEAQKIRFERKLKKDPNAVPETQRYLIPHLQGLKDHNGPKAFVFTHICERPEEVEAELRAEFKVLDENVPLYQCNPTCTRCAEANHFCVPHHAPGGNMGG